MRAIGPREWLCEFGETLPNQSLAARTNPEAVLGPTGGISPRRRAGPVEIIRKSSITTLSNSGVESEQILFPENSSSRRVTITRVTVQPGAINPPHRHPASEQVWVALEGRGTLLLDHARKESFGAGDVVRFEDGDLHGFHKPMTRRSCICRLPLHH
jgi:quercetin dioxygenase-like cupin family protein